MRSLVQVLSEIKLNLASVDQFIAIACGLADDNPEICDQIYDAAKLARSSALLIDHLRNLFGHQQSVEAELRQQADYQQKQQQNLNYQQQQQAASGFAQQTTQRWLQLEQNSQIFTYSNQLTLVRAAKCLVANVAKILYLTDSIALQAAGLSSLEASQKPEAHPTGAQIPVALRERLDNVANYCQLLRFFGELSCELVDLGQCIMFASERSHNRRHLASSATLAAPERQLARSARQALAPLNSDSPLPVPMAPMPIPPTQSYAALEQQQQQSQRPNWKDHRRNSHQYLGQAPLPAHFWRQQEAPQQRHQTHTMHPTTQGIRPSASSSSQLAACVRAMYAPSRAPETGEAEAEAGEVEVEVEADCGRRHELELQLRRLHQTTGDFEEGVWTKHPNDRRLEARAQDMQILFQANRSILLLLSASKCCLRQNEEFQRGFEARRCVVAQIRASVSIIMAVVKCSVFQHNGRLEAGASEATPIQQHCSALTESSTTCSNSNSAHNNNNANTNNASAPQRDNQFDYSCLGACQSAFSAPESAFLAQVGSASWLSKFHQEQLLKSITSANGNLTRRQNCNAQMSSNANANTNFNANCAPSGDLEFCSQTNKQTTSCQEAASLSAKMASASVRLKQLNAAESSLQIMNYFLQTWNGTQSAHDAINKLLLLVRPLSRVTDYKCLVGTLNGILRVDCSTTANRSPSNCSSNNNNNNNDQTDQSQDKENYHDETHQLCNLFLADLDGHRHQEHAGQMASMAIPASNHFMLMNKRQLVGALNRLFLGELKSNLVERCHEFTDCPYTSHEHRENIVLLLHCIKLQLNKLVKFIYRLRRNVGAVNETHLRQLRQMACQLDESLSELNQELQTVVIEQSDELDRCNNKLDLIKQIKHLCLAGDTMKTKRQCELFREQCDQLVENCKMLNQVAQTNKLKISTKTLAIWFELNVEQLIAFAQCLSENPHSRALKDATWAHLQVWCSFYDDFCQLARQTAYLAHSQYDPERSARVEAIREQLLMRRQMGGAFSTTSSASGAGNSSEIVGGERYAADELDGSLMFERVPDLNALHRQHNQQQQQQFARTDRLPVRYASDPIDRCAAARQLLLDAELADESFLHSQAHQHQQQQQQQQSHLTHTYSVQSVDLANELAGSLSDVTDSPRSLDHYYGFGPNYHRRLRAYSQQAHHAHPVQQPQAQQQRQLSEPADRDELAAFYAPSEHAGQLEYRMAPVGVPAPGPLPAPMFPPGNIGVRCLGEPSELSSMCEQVVRPPVPPARSAVSVLEPAQTVAQQQPAPQRQLVGTSGPIPKPILGGSGNVPAPQTIAESAVEELPEEAGSADQQSASSATEQDKWSDSDADAIVRGAKETAQMALSMYQFTRGEGDLNTTQDLFTQAELFAEEANELYKEVRCFSYKVPAGDLKRELLSQLGAIPALVQQLQFIVKNPTVGKPATFAKVDSVIRETRALMEAVNRVVTATLSCRQHYNMAIASMRKRTRTLSPSYRADKGFEFESHLAGRQSGLQAGRHGAGGGGMGSESDI